MLFAHREFFVRQARYLTRRDRMRLIFRQLLSLFSHRSCCIAFTLPIVRSSSERHCLPRRTQYRGREAISKNRTGLAGFSAGLTVPRRSAPSPYPVISPLPSLSIKPLASGPGLMASRSHLGSHGHDLRRTAVRSPSHRSTVGPLHTGLSTTVRPPMSRLILSLRIHRQAPR